MNPYQKKKKNSATQVYERYLVSTNELPQEIQDYSHFLMESYELIWEKRSHWKNSFGILHV